MLQSWSDVVARPKTRVLRQFSALWLVCLVALAARRLWQGETGWVTDGLAAVGVGLGSLGLIVPRAVRWLYTACMIVTFPLGVVLGQLVVAAIFYAVFTPVALIFRVIGRDPLHIRRQQTPSYWVNTTDARKPEDYLRQS